MGVPVATFAGQTFAGRHSVSHLNNIGFTESIANDFNSYVDIAVSLASELDKLARIRAGLRPQMQSSALCDGPRFAAAFSDLMRQV